MATPPNILLLMSDQHAPQVTGCMGADFVRTPHIDRLAERGVVFENAICNHPHCVPSRAALMTGLETHRIPCYDFLSPLPSHLPTWAHMLRRAGYRTELNGKMHFYGADQLHGFERHLNEPSHEKISGFRWGEENPDPAKGLQYWRDLHHEGDPLFERRMAGEQAKVADATSFLEKAAGDPAPFCLTVGFFGPHYPQICTEAMYRSYDGAAIPDPKPGGNLHERNAYWSDCWGFDRFTEADTAQGRQAYLAMVSHVDDWVGRILQTLEATGQAENTIVIYSSDHGEMWGEHGLWGKQCFYEESVRVPLVVAGPGVARGARVRAPVTLLDLYPTFRDLAGAGDWDVPLDGRSLAEPLAGGTLEARPVFAEYFGPDIAGPQRMVRDQDLKLNYYHRQGSELFDLAADPGEMRDRAGDPAMAGEAERLMGLLTEGWDPEALDAAVREDQNRRTLIGQSGG